ncbi:hypothetical protein HWV62_15711 [Athelia sp. TMB]|nr:hypothetical protein HWV62_15711 [Athelia sp. TMB]
MVSKSKGSKSGEQESSYAVKDIVLAKIRGFPAWPGMVVDPDTVPPAVQKERPTSKKTNFYCVRFFPAGDYSWTVAKDLSRLHAHEIDSFLGEPHKKSGDLYKGYEIAKDPEVWLIKQDAIAADIAEEEENAHFDQLESDGDSGEPKAGKTKKRKREADSAPVSKAKSKPKAKKTSEEPASKKKTGTSVKGKKNGVKSKAMVESEDEGGPEAEDDDSGPSKKAAAPASKKAKREKATEEDPLENDEEAKRVRDWRHKLQKSFLTPKAPPKPEDMPALDELFTSVEQYDKMSIQYLSVSSRAPDNPFMAETDPIMPQFSKIGKVMRHIAALTDDKVPRNDEYNFLARAGTLVDRWHEILNSKKSEGSNEGIAEPKTAIANGAGTTVDTGAMEVDATSAAVEAAT